MVTMNGSPKHWLVVAIAATVPTNLTCPPTLVKPDPRQVGRENNGEFGGSLFASNLSEYAGYVNFIGQVAAQAHPPTGGDGSRP
ncbi:MAG TPA: hypothetical protein VH374_16615 [Polyangia bacterium]|jgi:hypothetical protein|nr:hypothetical protein [Polyangia bacterium]